MIHCAIILEDLSEKKKGWSIVKPVQNIISHMIAEDGENTVIRIFEPGVVKKNFLIEKK